ncbi:hypothetical protein KY345_02375 [Candidatus Woesearchaeota archaeon]|nr:hypothetical protein [Candidatus Woesearchaeota archaeon]
MDELEKIRMKKMQEMQNQINNQLNEQINQEAQLLQQVEMIENAVKTRMTKEAIQRYGTIKMANPEKAIHVLMVMARALETKQVTQINDDLLKHFLGALTQKKDFNIKRV